MGCTKCCEGWLAADIYGHKMYPGKSCHFLDEASRCCSIYEDRPYDPCKGFFCGWRLNLDVPEEFSPNKTGVVIANQEMDGIKYISAAYAGKDISPEMLSWLLDYSNKNGTNVEWFIGGVANHVGSPEFLKIMQKRYSGT